MKKPFIVVTVAILILVPGTWFTVRFLGDLYRKVFNPYVEFQVSGPVSISTEWVELRPSQPLRAERQIQLVMIAFSQNGSPDVPAGGIKMHDGTTIVPVVELVDENNHRFPLEVSGFGQNGLSFSSPSDLPKDRVYPVVRIRANKSAHLTGVYWKCWNQWDVS